MGYGPAHTPLYLLRLLFIQECNNASTVAQPCSFHIITEWWRQGCKHGLRVCQSCVRGCLYGLRSVCVSLSVVCVVKRRPYILWPYVDYVAFYQPPKILLRVMPNAFKECLKQEALLCIILVKKGRWQGEISPRQLLPPGVALNLGPKGVHVCVRLKWCQFVKQYF